MDKSVDKFSHVSWVFFSCNATKGPRAHSAFCANCDGETSRWEWCLAGCLSWMWSRFLVLLSRVDTRDA